jgi:hypothetical protein
MVEEPSHMLQLSLIHPCKIGLTIYGPMIYTAPYVMVLVRASTLRGPFEGVGPESRDFFGPLNGYEQSECLLGPKSPKQCSIEVERFASARNRTWAACFR